MRPARLPIDALDNREIASACYVLVANPMLAPRFKAYIVDGELDWTGLLNDCSYSSGERILVDVAYALYSGRSTWWPHNSDETRRLSGFAEAVTSLDDENLRIVLNAIGIRRGWISLPAQLADDAKRVAV